VSRDDMMVVSGARRVPDGAVCFVGIGHPILAANLARLTHAPRAVLVFESGAIGAKPTRPPLSIADSELALTADVVVPMPEIFAQWLQNGKIDIGFLGAAQIDRFGNLNSTVIGDYGRPSVRLPGGGGAPEIAGSSGTTIVLIRQTRRTFVAALDFRTTVGGADGPAARAALGLRGGGVSAVITDLGVLEPDPSSGELTLVARHPGVSDDELRAATGWDLAIAHDVATTAPPTAAELSALAGMQEAAERHTAVTGRDVWERRLSERSAAG
jgi:glutaconate CoA-transferase subunit B